MPLLTGQGQAVAAGVRRGRGRGRGQPSRGHGGGRGQTCQEQEDLSSNLDIAAVTVANVSDNSPDTDGGTGTVSASFSDVSDAEMEPCHEARTRMASRPSGQEASRKSKIPSERESATGRTPASSLALPRGPATSRWNESTIWVTDKIAVVRRLDQAVTRMQFGLCLSFLTIPLSFDS